LVDCLELQVVAYVGSFGYPAMIIQPLSRRGAIKVLISSKTPGAKVILLILRVSGY